MTNTIKMWPGIAAGLILLCGCAVPQRLQSDKPLRYIRELRVNTQNDVRHCARMTEERGLRALRRLAETAEFEESWVFIPKVGEWVELGINEGREVVDEKDPRYRKRGVDLDGHFLNTVAERYREFTVYHIHNVKKRIVSNTVFYNPECSLPSYDDLCTDIKILNFYAQVNRGHLIRFKSVSLLGVTEVTFSQSARDRYEELLAKEDSVRTELSRLEGFNFLEPFHASVFEGSIRIAYRPLVRPR